MQRPPVPADEALRLRALAACRLLDTPAEERFDRLTRLARHLFGVSIALVSLVDENRQWFKSRQGLDACETGRDISFCGHAILDEAILEIPDATLDPRFADNPLVTGPPDIRFYAGAPLHTADGQRIGTLCIIDSRPHMLTAEDRRALRDLADCVEREINALEEAVFQARLAVSRQRSSDILRSLPDIVFLVDREGTFLECNEHPDMLQSREKVLGRRVADFLPPNITAQSMEAVAETLRSAELVRFDYTLDIADAPTPFEARIQRVDDASALIVIRNIRHERQAVENLRASQQRLAAVIDGTHIGTWEWNVQTGETVFNERWAQIVGHTLAELAPISIQTWLALAHPDDLKRSSEMLERHFNGEVDFYDVECRMRHKNGHWVWVHDRGRVVTRTADGKPLMMYGTHADNTAQKHAEQGLRDSEQQFRSLVDNIPGITYRCRLDEHWTMLFMSATADPLSGYPASDFIDNAVRSYVSVIHPDDRQRTEQAVLDGIRGDGKWNVEYRILHRDGGIRWVHERGAAVRDEQGHIEYLDGFILDISREKRARLEVERQLEAFAVLNEVAATHSTSLDDQLSRALRLAADYLLLEIGIISRIRDNDYQVRAFVAPDDMSLKLRQHFDLAETYCMLTLRSRDLLAIDHMAMSEYREHPCYRGFALEAYIGIPLTVSGDLYGTLNFSSRPARTSPFFESEKMFLRLLARWVVSVIERDRALQALKLSEARLRGLFELSPIGIALNDFDSGTFIEVNEALLAPSGYTREEFVALSHWDVTPREYEPQEHEVREEMLRTGRYGPYEKEYLRKDGSRYPVLLNGMVVADPAGRRLIWSIVEDISERRRIERMKNEFISTVSHELRTPLTAISGALGLLAGAHLGELPVPVREMLHIAQKNSRRLGLLINDLLDMEKLVAGKLRFELREQALRPIVEQALRDNQAYAEQFAVRLQLTSGPEAQVRVDADRLQQVLANLLSNAAKFSPQGGCVELAVHRADGRARVSVTDHGPGIPIAFHERIFQKFSQADASDARQRGGTGLGLAISRELVERMGGTIGFESVKGHGATFWFEFNTTDAGGA